MFLVGGIFLFPSPVVSFDSPKVSCQNPEICFTELLVVLDQLESAPTQLSKAEALFQQLVTGHAHTKWAQRARLRFGHALRTFKPQKAIPLLQHSLSAFPIIDDYIQFWLLEAYQQAELWEEAAKIIRVFSVGQYESRLRAEVLYEGGTVFLALDDCPGARSTLMQAMTLESQHPKKAYALFQVGTCAGQLGEYGKKDEIFRELWWRFPLAPESQKAEALWEQEKDPVFVPTVEERYQRGMSLYRGGALTKAIKEFQQVVVASQKTPLYFHAQFMLAKAWFRLKQYHRAEQVLQVLTQSSSSRQDDAWVWLGRTYLRQGKGEALGHLIRTLPTNQLAGDQQAQLQTFYGIWLDDHDRWSDAVNVYEKASQVAHTLSKKVESWWKVGWLYFQRQQFPEAIKSFQKIVEKTRDPQSVSFMHALSRGLYWLACSEEHMGQLTLAAQHFEEVSQAFPLTYYGQLAQTKLGREEKRTQSWTELVSTTSSKNSIPLELQQDAHFQKLQALQMVKLSEEALKEFEHVYALYGSNARVFPQLVALAGSLGAYDIGVRLTIRQFGQTLRTGKIAPTSPAWSGAFPLGYQTIIQAVVPPHVDPYLVSGLIREESLYSSRVVSPAGAYGLMQLMPATAKRVAGQLKLLDSGFDREHLFQPQVNIQLGTHYLGQLLKEFQGNIIHAVAAYNAGPQAVRRWIAKYPRRSSDEFVELIGYRETRGYVKRVIGSYRIYRALFGQPCPPISLDRFC